jgi:hypothetical protein
LTRKQNDGKALAELDSKLRELDPNDPVKYDFVFLFGLYLKVLVIFLLIIFFEYKMLSPTTFISLQLPSKFVICFVLSYF